MKKILFCLTLICLIWGTGTGYASLMNIDQADEAQKSEADKSFSCSVSDEEKAELGYPQEDRVYLVCNEAFLYCSLYGDKAPEQLFKEGNKDAVRFVDDGTLFDMHLSGIQYKDYTKSIYANALNTENNVLTQKYNDIVINDMFIFDSETLLGGGFAVYYKTTKGDYIYFKETKISSAQYLFSYDEYLEELKNIYREPIVVNDIKELDSSKLTYTGIGLSYEFLQAHKVDLIGGDEAVSLN